MGSSPLLLLLLLCLLCHVLLLQTISLTEEGTALTFDLYHAQGPGMGNQSSDYLSAMLARDETRVHSLVKRIMGTEPTRDTRARPVSLGTESVTVPTSPGVSIGSGNYYVRLGLGTPPRSYSMIMDTGSSLAWLQCKPCSGYCHAQVDPVFDPSASRTYKTSGCRSAECALLKEATLNDPLCSRAGSCIYEASYGDASISIGFLARDTLTLGQGGSFPGFIFGCGQDNEGLFGRAAGIFGLARQPLSMLGQLSPKLGSAFSYCLPSFTGSGKGYLSVGKGSLAPASYKFTPMLSGPSERSLYYLSLATVKVGGRPLPVAAADYRARTIIDSGTVITRLPAAIYSALKQAFSSAMRRRFAAAPGYSILDTCFRGSLRGGGSAGVPVLQLVFEGGAELVLRPENALIDIEPGTTCLAFAATSSGVAIIGNRQQQSFEVLYDVASSKIGFAPGRCN
ncbi:hypothetical protein SAY87_019978 [Trapa incisa]|uniref:Peptidase A1 domain-containing protein n=1 Tax=Trapa incisa TaxID=236973 RepID=A0AAN7K6J8_9MYRT|nr:hypothetical protein SAY87_019978 [Trapa incisa]